MTDTSHPVRRVSVGAFRFGGRSRRIVVKIGPGDVLELRECGRRYKASLPLEWCYRKAVFLRVAAERLEKLARRGASERRRPRRRR